MIGPFQGTFPVLSIQSLHSTKNFSLPRVESETVRSSSIVNVRASLEANVFVSCIWCNRALHKASKRGMSTRKRRSREARCHAKTTDLTTPGRDVAWCGQGFRVLTWSTTLMMVVAINR